MVNRRRSTALDIDAVDELYRERAPRVREVVRLLVRAPEPVIDDACQFAWSRLVQHRRRIEPGGAQAWLVRTAAREAVKQIRRQRRDVSLEALLEAAGDEFEPCGTQTFAELIDRRDRLAAIHALPERQRRLIWLQGLGLSYREMARETGATERTVERQLMRARRRLSAVTG